LIVLIVACGFFAFRWIGDRQMQVGACLDYYPSAIFDYDVDANVVDCDSDEAQSKIVSIHDSGDGQCSTDASLSDGDRVFCLARA
jgi:hypothetical protein